MVQIVTIVHVLNVLNMAGKELIISYVNFRYHSIPPAMAKEMVSYFIFSFTFSILSICGK